MEDLSGKVVLVTGAARGMGRLQATNFAREGCRVLITDVDSGELEKTAGEIKNQGLETRPYQLDVSKREDCLALGDTITSEVGPVDILVNNAGVVVCAEVLQTSEADARRMMDVNYFGQLWMMQAFVPEMVARGRGHVVNMCSSAGKMGVARLGAYCATKFAAIGLSDSIRPELRKTGVRFTIVNPGFVNTGMFAGAKVPPITRWQDPQKVADAVVRAVKKRHAEICVPRFAVRLVAVVRGLCVPRLSDPINRFLRGHRSFENWRRDPSRPF